MDFCDGDPWDWQVCLLPLCVNRYRQEHPNKPIVTASFSKNRVLKQCLVFYPDGRVQHSLDRRYYIPTAQEIPDAFHLYDGPPEIEPPDSQMVAFTSPNEDWLRSIVRAVTHCTLYMPVWTFQELSDASELLDLDIEMEALQQRFGMFGGVARYCLGVTQEFVEEGLKELHRGIEKIRSFDDIDACIQNQRDYRDIVHRVFHYEPTKFRDTEYCFFADLRFGSKWIAAKVAERIRNQENFTRMALMRVLNGVSKGASLNGWLFEQFAHETFQIGGEFTLFSLDSGEPKTLKLEPEVGHYDKFSTPESLEKVFQDVYLIPDATNFEGLDSFYYCKTDNVMYVFQVTMSVVHDVKANGLVKLLELTGLIDDVQGLFLVFVIPKGLGGQFKKQSITFDDIPKIEDLATYSVSQVKGIGSTKRFKRLRDAGINSGKELYDAVKAEAPEISFVSSIGAKFVKNVETRRSWESLTTIPQFYIELALTK